MSLLDKIKQNSTIKGIETFDKSTIMESEEVKTEFPILNIALSGSIDGGLRSGLTVLAGASKSFKSYMALMLGKAFLDTHKDGAVLLMDSEFGMTQEYFNKIGLDMQRVIHVPITDIDQLKFETVQQLEKLDRDDKLMIIVDSVGNLASVKETEDAKSGKSVADMSRAKMLKGFFRIVTPQLTVKSVPMIVINHTYQTQELYSKDVVSGGQGIYYSANQIFIIKRTQIKEGTDITGYNFVINIEKSRVVKEKSKLPLTINNNELETFSGIFELALEGGFITSPSQGWYSTDGKNKVRRKDIDDEVLSSIVSSEEFNTFIQNKYKL